MSVWVSTHVETRGNPCAVLSSAVRLLRDALSLSQSSPNRPDSLASGLQESPCLRLPSAGVHNTTHSISTWVELRSSCWQGQKYLLTEPSLQPLEIIHVFHVFLIMFASTPIPSRPISGSRKVFSLCHMQLLDPILPPHIMLTGTRPTANPHPESVPSLTLRQY